MSNPKTTLDLYNYESLIVEYTKREVTFESDTIDAFSGIIEAIPDDFFWGIPYSAFGEYLTWTVYRPPWDDGRSGDQRRDCGLKLPSWSWFGWKGVITLANDRKPTQSLLSVYRWQDGKMAISDRPVFPKNCLSLIGTERTTTINETKLSSVTKQNGRSAWMTSPKISC